MRPERLEENASPAPRANENIPQLPDELIRLIMRFKHESFLERVLHEMPGRLLQRARQEAKEEFNSFVVRLWTALCIMTAALVLCFCVWIR